jgi:hypothetical protein
VGKRMRVIFIFAGILLFSLSYAQEVTISDEILRFRDRDEFMEHVVIEYGKKVYRNYGEELFEEFKNNRTTKTWLALHKYLTFTDASGTIEFYNYCYQALKREPLVYYSRYMEGDDNAIHLMESALSHDFRVFDSQRELGKKTIRSVYETSLTETLKHKPSDPERKKRHDVYIKGFIEKLKEWDQSFKND